MGMTEAQKRAQKKYREKNKAKQRYWNEKSKAKVFIKNHATSEDLKELEKLIEERENYEQDF